MNDPQGNEIEKRYRVDRGHYNCELFCSNRDPSYAAKPDGEGQELLKQVKNNIASKILTARYYQAKLDVMRIQTQHA